MPKVRGTGTEKRRGATKKRVSLTHGYFLHPFQSKEKSMERTYLALATGRVKSLLASILGYCASKGLAPPENTGI